METKNEKPGPYRKPSYEVQVFSNGVWTCAGGRETFEQAQRCLETIQYYFEGVRVVLAYPAHWKSHIEMANR